MTTKRRPLAFTVLAVALLVVPLLEILAIIQVGRVIGGWQTVALLLLLSTLGAWLVRREGSRTWDALRSALTSGQMPAAQLVDAALVLVGGVLLLAPGFLSDIVGFFFILPMTRAITGRWLQAIVERQLLARAGIVRGTVR